MQKIVLKRSHLRKAVLMCGIVGYLGPQAPKNIIMNGVKGNGIPRL